MYKTHSWHFPWHWLWILLAVLALMLLLPAHARYAPRKEVATPTLSSRVVVAERVMSREAPDGCVRPSPEDFFFTGDAYAHFWVRIDGARQGDRPAVSWIRPDGLLHRTDLWDPLPSEGPRCLTARMAIAGDAPSDLPGRWLARLSWNNMLLAEHEFAVLDPSRPMITE